MYLDYRQVDEKGEDYGKQVLLCKSATESCNHILFWCPVAYNLWVIIYDLLGINWVITGSMRD